jgi:hypothetical protein
LSIYVFSLPAVFKSAVQSVNIIVFVPSSFDLFAYTTTCENLRVFLSPYYQSIYGIVFKMYQKQQLESKALFTD